MLKRILHLSILLMINVAVAHAQDLLVTPSDTLILDTTSSCQSESILTFSIKNTTTSALQMNWRVIYNTCPHGWTIDYCDPNVCLSQSQIGSHTLTFTLDSLASGLMQFEPTPATGTACCNYQIFTWASNDSARTATYLNYESCITTPINCNTGITEAEVGQISIYPNPVRNDLKVTLPQNLSNGLIDIYDLIGSKVYSQPISATKDLDMSTLQTGIYVARIYENGKIVATKKFTKID